MLWDNSISQKYFQNNSRQIGKRFTSSLLLTSCQNNYIGKVKEKKILKKAFKSFVNQPRTFIFYIMGFKYLNFFQK